MQEYAMGPSGFGWLVSLINVAPMLLAGVAGYWIWVFGLKRALILGACLQGILALATTYLENATWVYVLRSLEGVPYLVVVVAAPTLIASVSSGALQARLLAFWGTYYFFGVSFMTVLSTWGFGGIGWRSTFASVVGSGVIFALFAGISLKQTKTNPANEEATKVKLGSKVLLLCFGFFGIAMMAVSLPSIVPLFLVDQLDLDQVQAGTLVGTAVFASAGGSIFYGLCNAFLPDRLLSPGTLTVTAVGVVFLFSLGPGQQLLAQTVSVICFAALGCLAAMVFAAIPKLAVDMQRVSAANGWLTQTGSAGALVGPPMYLFVFEKTGWQTVAMMVVCVAVSTTILLHLALSGADHRGRDDNAKPDLLV